VTGRSWESHVPDAIDALMALISPPLEALGVMVKDGPWISGETKRDVVCIGWPGFGSGYQYPSRSMGEDLGSPDVTFESVQSGLGPSVLERFTVNCVSIARVGTTKNISAARRTAYANLAVIGGLIKPPWISGTTIKATMGSAGMLHQIQDRSGMLAVVTFGIACEAFAGQ
jgi:hypothetical protein